MPSFRMVPVRTRQDNLERYHERGKDMKDLIYQNNVYELRKEQRISQDKMAADLGISRRSISKIENGDQNLSLEMAYRIAAYFEKLIPEVFPLLEEHLPSLSEMREQTP